MDKLNPGAAGEARWELHRQPKDQISDHKFSIWCDGDIVVLANPVPGEEGVLATIVDALNKAPTLPRDAEREAIERCAKIAEHNVCKTKCGDPGCVAAQVIAASIRALPSIPPREGVDRWLPVYLYPDDNSIVLVANPDEGRMPVVAWKIEDKWFKYDLTERGPLDPQPTLWTTWPKLPKAALSPSPTSVMPDEGEAGT